MTPSTLFTVNKAKSAKTDRKKPTRSSSCTLQQLKSAKTDHKKTTPSTLSTVDKAKSANSSTARVRKHRQRLDDGMRVYELVLPSAALELMLTDCNFLASLKADDHASTQAALQKMVDTALSEYLTASTTAR